MEIKVITQVFESAKKKNDNKFIIYDMIKVVIVLIFRIYITQYFF